MRFYHPGETGESRPLVPTIKHPEHGHVVARPLIFCPTDAHGNHIPQYEPCHPASVVIGFKGYGFWVVPPGEFVDLPNELSVALVKAHAPQLLTEEEALAKGLAVKVPETVPAKSTPPAHS